MVRVQVTFGLVTEFKEMQKWDAMLISLDVLDEHVKAYPITHVGTFISTYGVPGKCSCCSPQSKLVQV
jgi:hypothetical protein